VLANIHDAMIVRRRLRLDLRHEIEMRMQDATDNNYWHLSATEIKRYSKADMSIHAS
jgi:hypothetical protein